MTELSMTLAEYLRKINVDLDGNFLHEGMRLLAQLVMEGEVSEQIGAGKYQRTPDRKTQRNGHRERLWDTRVGSIELAIPRLREGSYYPSFIEPRRRVEKALLAVVQQAHIEGVSTRKVDDLLQSLGLAVGASESEAFWSDFLRSLVGRGLKGVPLVILDNHLGLKAAVGKVLSGATWQRCRVHFMRNLLAYVPQRDTSMIAALVRMVFAQPNRQAAGQQLAETVKAMQPRWPKAAAVLAAAEDDVLAYMAFPMEHWTRIYSTNPLERLNREIKRRTDVVGVFPDDASVVRLVGAVLMERADEWEVDRRPFSLESMRKLTAPESSPCCNWRPVRCGWLRSISVTRRGRIAEPDTHRNGRRRFSL